MYRYIYNYFCIPLNVYIQKIVYLYMYTHINFQIRFLSMYVYVMLMWVLYIFVNGIHIYI